MITSNHTYKEISVPIKYNEVEKRPIRIDSDVWISCGSRILAGVHIESRCIIAAGCVVNKDCEANSIYGGVPNKKLKSMEMKSTLLE